MSLRPVRSQKRENTWTNLGQNASTLQGIVIVNTVDDPTTGAQCSIGSHIKSIYFETNLNGVDNSGSVAVFHWMIYKDPNGSFGNLDPTSYDPQKKRFILKRGMEMLPEIPIGSGGTVQTKRVFVVKIPKVYQRMADADKFMLTYKSTSASGINYCGFTILKYFS